MRAIPKTLDDNHSNMDDIELHRCRLEIRKYIAKKYPLVSEYNKHKKS